MSLETKTIAESNNFIVLDKYTKIDQEGSSYQSEADLENELICDLSNQGYEFLNDLNSPDKMLVNVRKQLQELNKIEFSNSEWNRFCEEYLDRPSDNIIDKTRKIHDDYIYDFTFDNGIIKNIYLLDKKNIARNKVQVINQFEIKGKQANRYDVTILVNGLPLVQIELKKRGVAIREAFNQVHRYSKESFNSENSLYKYLQIFVISNGTDSRYFANTTKRDKNSFDFTMNWAKSDNTLIKDLKDFTATFLQKKTLLDVLINYSVFDTSDTLLIMRPYQIAATERLIWKVTSSYEAKRYSTIDGGGFIWHTTGSGKTLTSFKAARLATSLDFIDKVFFVVDRKDLDFQTMKEYQRFSPDSVNGSDSTAGLKQNIEKDDNKIIVTTIQKLNNLMKSENDLDIYSKQVVFIFDECHRSQFGDTHKKITQYFENYQMFGFTGTPIFVENALSKNKQNQTTASLFGEQLHSYVITDAIKDENVLRFSVEYVGKYRERENSQNEIDIEVEAIDTQELLESNDRIEKITNYVIQQHPIKTQNKTFTAMFCVSSVEMLIKYYDLFLKLKQEGKHNLNIATIFSFGANDSMITDTEDYDEKDFNEVAEPKESYNSYHKRDKLEEYIIAYNLTYGTNWTTKDSQSFYNYYKDIAQRVRTKQVDILFVVNMFLTGFDSKSLNTLFVDKNLKYHGLIQAYSRTNRILGDKKSQGNIVVFRNLKKATDDAIALFSDKRQKKLSS